MADRATAPRAPHPDTCTPPRLELTGAPEVTPRYHPRDPYHALRTGEGKVYRALLRLLPMREGTVSLGRLADETGLSVRTVKRGLACLRALEFVRTTRTGRGMHIELLTPNTNVRIHRSGHKVGVTYDNRCYVKSAARSASQRWLRRPARRTSEARRYRGSAVPCCRRWCSRSQSLPKSLVRSCHTAWAWLPPSCALSYSMMKLGPWTR